MAQRFILLFNPNLEGLLPFFYYFLFFNFFLAS